MWHRTEWDCVCVYNLTHFAWSLCMWCVCLCDSCVWLLHKWDDVWRASSHREASLRLYGWTDVQTSQSCDTVPSHSCHFRGESLTQRLLSSGLVKEGVCVMCVFLVHCGEGSTDGRGHFDISLSVLFNAFRCCSLASSVYFSKHGTRGPEECGRALNNSKRTEKKRSRCLCWIILVQFKGSLNRFVVLVRLDSMGQACLLWFRPPSPPLCRKWLLSSPTLLGDCYLWGSLMMKNNPQSWIFCLVLISWLLSLITHWSNSKCERLVLLEKNSFAVSCIYS